jgi:putative oxygen-independent coproporphyrinogen III oxidase
MGTAIARTGHFRQAPKPRMTSVYVHFPWCLAKCPYCDFVSYASARDSIDHEGYADAVIRELDRRVDALTSTEAQRRVVVGSVFFGGGTPSLWAPSALGRVLTRIREKLSCREDLEVTVECNPTSLDRTTANALFERGVHRLSIGAQALRDEQLRFLGRLHDVSGAQRAIEAALSSGVPRVSADMIFGLPGQTPDDARDQARSLVAMGLRHLSAYQLTIEAGTKFGELSRAGRLPRADDGDVAAAFVAIEDALSARGLFHYEISNYATEGEEARHNLSYWKGEEYLGLGCGAYGFVREHGASPARGARYRNPIEPATYLEQTRRLPALASASVDLKTLREAELLDASALLRERIMLGLRLSIGFDLGAAARELGIAPWTKERERAASWLERRERLERRGDHLRIPRTARLWADDTAARLF